MGGIGSGRRWGNGYRSTTDAYRSIDVRRWRRDGLLEPGRYFGWQWTREGEETGSIRVRIGHGNLRLMYRQRDYGEEWQDMDYPVHLTWTNPNLGGSRPWFLCPARGCGRSSSRGRARWPQTRCAAAGCSTRWGSPPCRS